MSTDVLCLFAHQDDEYGIAPRIVFEIENGHRVSCVYLTDGSGKGSNSQTRDAESRAVLSRLGVRNQDIFFHGSLSGTPDGGLVNHLDSALAAVNSWVEERDLKIETIYCPAWEGGHVDHDACHLVGAAAASQLNVRNVWQFPLYNGEGVPWKFFRVLKPLRGKPARRRRLTVRAAVGYALLCFRYRSQMRTWLSLFPEAFFRRAILREEVIQPLARGALTMRPHDGPLLYERLFGGDYGAFARTSQSFRERHRLSGLDASLQ